MLRLEWVLICIALAAGPAVSEVTNTDPEAAQLITTDIPNFWRACDRLDDASSRKDSLKAFFDAYYLEASPGLQEFIRIRIGSVYNLVNTICGRQKYYDSIRANTLRVAEMEPAIRAGFRKLRTLYPAAVFPDVTFVIGRMTSGGTLTDKGLFIGTEFYAKAADSPEDELGDWERAVIKSIDGLPFIVTHELMHYQQRYPDERSLLGQSIKEGSADFVAELVTGGNINAHVHEWATSRQADLWREFESVMHGDDFSRWLYNGSNSTDRPADLGYYIGYKIAEAYYEQAADKTEAIRDIFNIEDFDAFLAASGYETAF